MDLLALIRRLMEDGTIRSIANNPLAQFTESQRRARIYLGAQLLPERQTENDFTDFGIRYRTVIANDGSRYSPAQLKSDEGLVGSVKVSVGHSDIARQFTGRDYDLFLALLRTRPELEAVTRLLDWTDITINRALLDLNEKQRWQAFVAASVVRKGDNGYNETVAYPNPSGHRVAAGGDWASDADDPLVDLQAGVDKLAEKGYNVSRMVGSTRTSRLLARNAKMRERAAATLLVGTDGTISGRPPTRLAPAALNAILQAEGFPALETYDEQYRDYEGAHRFLDQDALVMFATTGRDEMTTAAEFDESGQFDVLTDTLGYTAIGRPVGESDSGRVIRMWPFDNKPPRIEAEGWQASIPVITEPEALFVITGIGE